MFNYFYFYYYPLPFFLNSIFSLFLIVFLGIITPYIIILANKNEDYKNKKIFIIYEKAISILLILHIILTLISILINIFRVYFGAYFIIFIIALIIGVLGIAIIYGICYILDKNNIAIDKSIINKIFYYIKKIKKIIVPKIAPIIITICVLCIIKYIIDAFPYIDFFEVITNISDNINYEYTHIILIIAIILAAIFCLFIIISFNSKLNKINKNIENNKSASSSEVETTKKDNNDNDYII